MKIQSMKTVIKIAQVLVAVLFIVSGLVKANDPLGLAYKMEEFFELWNGSLAAGSFFLKSPLMALFDFLRSQSLALSIIMITLEIVAGVALLIGWKKRLVLYLLLILIIFFTFLTGYAYLSGKFTNCGCFGDCLPISPFTSFLKDIALLVLIVALLAGQRHIRPLYAPGAGTVLLVSSLVLSLALQWYVLNYLPLVDCLPFKKGNNVAEQMKPPAGSIPDSVAIRFIYEKDGKRYEFAPESLPADFSTYKFIDRVDKVVRKGNAEPKLKGFSLTSASGEDAAASVLQQSFALVLFCLEDDDLSWMNGFKSVADEAAKNHIPVYIAAPSIKAWEPLFDKAGIRNAQLFSADFTVLRTVARTNPTLLVLKAGTVVKKYSRNKLPEAGKDLSAGKL
jgi:uncharacterized membrane protein YphA (DoxX/SURF4 family)